MLGYCQPGRWLKFVWYYVWKDSIRGAKGGLKQCGYGPLQHKLASAKTPSPSIAV
jgi:hypothetical protein